MIPQFLADHSSIRGALPILFDAAIKGALLVFVAAAAAYLLRKRSAASRHAVWTAAVIGHLAIPVLVLLLPAWKLPVLPAPSWLQTEASAPLQLTLSAGETGTGDVTIPDRSVDEAATKGSQQIVSPKAATGPLQPNTTGQPALNSAATSPGAPLNASSASPSSSSSRPTMVETLALIWFAGALIILLRLAVGTWRVNQLAREGARVEDGRWLSLAQRLANRLGVTRPLILLRGERLAVPVTWGIVYPAVLLPHDSETWTEERKRFVLVHEMAHVKRFDALTQLLAQISLALFWFDPLVWVAAHQMRVEREHACDDYVLRDGTTPSLYAGELLEMVRSIGTPTHDRAAPAFAALAMARRSEFEGRMLAILDPRLDRHNLTKRSTVMTALIIALLTFPLAAWRPFQQPVAGARPDEFPESFKVSISGPDLQRTSVSQAAQKAATSGTIAEPASATTPAAPSQSSVLPANPTVNSAWSCDSRRLTRGTSTSSHIDVNDSGRNQIIQFMQTTADLCSEATVVGPAKFSEDETRLAELAPGGFARFREITATTDRAVSAVPVGDGSISYSAMHDGRTVQFDAAMQSWLAQFLPRVLREAAINVEERVARIRAQGGVSAVLKEIGEIRSTSSKRAHYEALLNGAPMSQSDGELVTIQAGGDLVGSSSDLSSIIQQLPRSSMKSAPARQAIASALSRIQSSGDRANTLQVLAPTADPEMLLILAKAAEDLPSSGDKANFLIATASEYLTPGSDALRNAFFRTAATVQSSGDMANVLISAMPYGHGNPPVTLDVVETSKRIASSGDTENVLISLASQRLLQPGTTRATLAVITRTLTMASSGDRANVLISLAGYNLLSNAEVRDAFAKAAMALPSDGDRANVLAAAANR